MPEDHDFPEFKSKEWADAAKKELASLKKKSPKKKKLSKDEQDDVVPKSKGLFIKGKRAKGINDRNIRSLLDNSIIEVVFTRRIWPIKFPNPGQQTPVRRMLATADWKYLNSNKSVFKWEPPGGVAPRGKVWYKRKRLIIVHDLIRQQWRHISLDEYSIVNIIPVKNKQQQDDFIKKYKNLLKKYGRKKLIKWFNK